MTTAFPKLARPLPGFRDGGRQRFVRSNPPSERDRVRLALAKVIGGGYVVYALMVTPQMVEQGAGLVPSWYPLLGAPLAFGPGIAMLVAAFVGRWQRAVPALVICCTVGVLSAAALWLALASGSSTVPAGWILDFAGLAGLTLVMVRPVIESVLALAAAKLSGAAVAVTGVVGADWWEATEEALFGIVFTSIFILVIHQVLRIGSALDASRAHTESTVAQGVANIELARVDALIHDHVLSTFVAVGADRNDPRVAKQAAAALVALDGVSDDSTFAGVAVIDGPEVVARLRAVISGVDGDCPVEVEVSDDAMACPTNVVAALAEAAAEAVRNVAAHAGADAQRAVFIGVGPELVQLIVTDDGVGFDPDEVPHDRLGLALSIRQRVGGLPGGEAAVISGPGEGCTVRLRWTPSDGGID